MTSNACACGGTCDKCKTQNADDGQPSDRIDPDKACQILHDKTAQGRPLTDDQRKMFGAACGEATKNSFWSWLGNALGITSNVTDKHPSDGKFIAKKDVLGAHAGHEFKKTLEGEACPDCGGWMSGGKCQVCGYTKGSEEKAETTPTGAWNTWSDETPNWGEMIANDNPDTTENNWSDAAREAAAAARKATASSSNKVQLSTYAAKASKNAVDSKQHEHAATMHEGAAVEHSRLSESIQKNAPDHPAAEAHAKAAAAHEIAARSHRETAATLPKVETKVSYMHGKKPANNSEGDTTVATKLTANERKDIVDKLVTNCKCNDANVWEESDRAALNSLPDAKLLRLKAQRDLALRNEDSEDDSSYLEERDEENERRMKGKKTENTVAAQLTPNQLISTMNTLNKVNHLTAHITDDAKRQQMVMNLATKTDAELNMLIELLPPQPQQKVNNFFTSAPVLPNFIGAGGQRVDNATTDDATSQDDVLPIQNMDWAEIAKERSANMKKTAV